MHIKDRMADHQEQQTCEANTDNSQAIPVGSVGQKHSDRPLEDIIKLIEKINTYDTHIHPQRMI